MRVAGGPTRLTAREQTTLGQIQLHDLHNRPCSQQLCSQYSALTLLVGRVLHFQLSSTEDGSQFVEFS